GERIQIPGIEYERLLADRGGSEAQGQTDMGVVQMIGRADAEVIDPLFVFFVSEALQVPIEAFELREERGFGEVAVDDADRIMRIHRRHEPVARVADRLEMPGGDVTGESCKSKVLHVATGSSLF